MVGLGVRSQEERVVPGGEPLYQYGSSVGRQQAAPGSYLQCGLFLLAVREIVGTAKIS